jgi:Arc-like DNA binding dprotein
VEAMVARKTSEIVSTRLRLPTGLHRMLVTTAKRNNRSLNSEILWCIAQQLGGEAPKFVEHMAAEQRRVMHNVLRALIANPEEAAKAIASFDKRIEEKP